MKANKMKKLVMERGLTVSDLSKYISCPAGTLYSVFNARTGLSRELCEAIEYTLKLPRDAFLDAYKEDKNRYIQEIEIIREKI